MRAQARGSDSPFSSTPGGAAICISSSVPVIVQMGDPDRFFDNFLNLFRTCEVRSHNDLMRREYTRATINLRFLEILSS